MMSENFMRETFGDYEENEIDKIMRRVALDFASGMSMEELEESYSLESMLDTWWCESFEAARWREEEADFIVSTSPYIQGRLIAELELNIFYDDVKQELVLAGVDYLFDYFYWLPEGVAQEVAAEEYARLEEEAEEAATPA